MIPNRIGHRSVGRPSLSRAGVVTSIIGAAWLLAAIYRTLVLMSDGRLRPLVEVAVRAPLAGEFLALVGLVICAAGVLLLAASRRRP